MSVSNESDDIDSYHSNESEEEYLEIVSKEIRDLAKELTFDLLPPKSRQDYVKYYNAFKKWRKEKGTNSYCEDVFLAFFGDLSKKYCPSSLWTIYSMLKATMLTFHKIDISTYKKVIAFIKRKNEGYVPKKSEVFENEHITKFLNEAPDHEYLAVKVAVIFGILGGLRRQELTNVKVKDVIVGPESLFVRIPITKNKKPKSFTIADAFVDVVKKYIELRPSNCDLDRFFLRYAKGKCSKQPIGIKKFGSMPREMAVYLKLPEPSAYTGHSLRRTSTTLLADGGGSTEDVMRHGGWQSIQVAQSYIAESKANKTKIHDKITSGIKLVKSRVQSSDSSNVLKEKNSNHLVQVNDQSRKEYMLDIESMPIDIATEDLAPNVDDSGNATLNDMENSTKENSTVPRKQYVSLQKQVDINQNEMGRRSKESESVRNHHSNEKPKQKYPVFYHPDFGLYGLEMEDNSISYVLENCDVELGSGIHGCIIMNNCNVALKK